MKNRLIFVNLAFILYLAGLICVTAGKMQVGAIIVIISAVIISGAYFLYLYLAIRNRKFFTLNVLMYTVGMLVLTEIFINGFSHAIGQGLGSLRGFFQVHILAGLLLLSCFAWFSYSHTLKIPERNKRIIVLIALTISCILSLVGFFGFMGIVNGTTQLIYHSFVWLTFFYFLYFLAPLLFYRSKLSPEQRTTLLLSSLMLLFWIFRWQIPALLPPGIGRVLFNFGFLMVIVLPMSILFITKNHFMTVFILYSVVLDLYFISFDRDFQYTVQVGIKACVGYDDAIDYVVVTNPGTSFDDLFRAPEPHEVAEIIQDWRNIDFSPQAIVIEYIERSPRGDTLKVISHEVSGKKHYGLMRIPAGVDARNAPILLWLHGGGAGPDVLKSSDLDRIVSGNCRNVLDRYITIAPSFRGDILKGENFCFRSEGYTGDVWSGPAHDAVSFLEAVKSLYSRDDSTKVLSMGVSRGATVGLIIGALTDKLNYVIAISTHTDFLSLNSLRNERVGSDYARVFFTPETSPAQIRKRLISSSPYYFAEGLPDFEIHQGTRDVFTAPAHAQRLERRLRETGRDPKSARIHFYDGKDHGYRDDNAVCKSLAEFITR